MTQPSAVAFHAREAHDCDHKGHEGDREAAIAAQKMADRIEAALLSRSTRGGRTSCAHAWVVDWHRHEAIGRICVHCGMKEPLPSAPETGEEG